MYIYFISDFLFLFSNRQWSGSILSSLSLFSHSLLVSYIFPVFFFGFIMIFSKEILVKKCLMLCTAYRLVSYRIVSYRLVLCSLVWSSSLVRNVSLFSIVFVWRRNGVVLLFCFASSHRFLSALVRWKLICQNNVSSFFSLIIYVNVFIRFYIKTNIRSSLRL